jgi:hypothetical protein
MCQIDILQSGIYGSLSAGLNQRGALPRGNIFIEEDVL